MISTVGIVPLTFKSYPNWLEYKLPNVPFAYVPTFALESVIFVSPNKKLLVGVPVQLIEPST